MASVIRNSPQAYLNAGISTHAETTRAALAAAERRERTFLLKPLARLAYRRAARSARRHIEELEAEGDSLGKYRLMDRIEHGNKLIDLHTEAVRIFRKSGDTDSAREFAYKLIDLKIQHSRLKAYFISDKENRAMVHEGLYKYALDYASNAKTKSSVQFFRTLALEYLNRAIIFNAIISEFHGNEAERLAQGIGTSNDVILLANRKASADAIAFHRKRETQAIDKTERLDDERMLLLKSFREELVMAHLRGAAN